MIELEVPKDIRKYETKLIGPFTTRQFICFIIAVGIAAGFYYLLHSYLERDLLFFLIIVLDIPAVLCGWFKPYGMTFENFIRTALKTTVLSPAVRKYVIENKFSDKLREDKLKQANLKAIRKKQKKSKTHIAYK